jgi:hypothetical protein
MYCQVAVCPYTTVDFIPKRCQISSLRQRRLQLAIQFSKAGYLVRPILLSMVSIEGAIRLWLEQLCPWKGAVKVVVG